MSLLATVLVALALSAPATAGRQVPFKGMTSGLVTTAGFDPVTGTVSLYVVGKGVATHLGHFTAAGDTAIDVATGSVPGVDTLTAANGDQLFLTFVAHGINADHGAGAFTVMGGTGRFQGASGYFEQLITFAVPPSSAYTDVFAGTISSPDSNR